MPAGTKVGEAEASIRHYAGKKGKRGRAADRYVYGALNNMGFMRGNKVTRKGAQRAHNAMTG